MSKVTNFALASVQFTELYIFHEIYSEASVRLRFDDIRTQWDSLQGQYCELIANP